ncbi:MAG: chalcone isomerase [Flavobacterium sp.]|uniref:chalcone isomerase family protein n=1 Tax=unclassified Flavobacterium TaxID=196869 RepID=UPI000C5C24F8|nr:MULTISPECIES: chalcone isomerase family protein [unclassified Flavobacterium]MBF02182.1 chalcone isomerase [Flavobacterium sp.]MCO6163288.1 chalcone isomerase family protein [Flavobacterium sp. NRK F7]
MKKIILLLAFLLSVSAFSQDDLDVDGIKIKKHIKVRDSGGKTKLVLNGYGIRDKMWINLYVQALYLTEKTDDPKKILDSDETIATRLYVTSSLVTREKLIKAIEEGIEKSYQSELEPLRERMNKFMSFFESVTEKGYVEFVYSKEDVKTYVFINDKLTGEIEGLDFRKALFGIWLEDRCVDRTLKKRLLGK